MSNTINTIIQLRNDTAADWATEAGKATPLQPGEVAVVINDDGSVRAKVGTAVNQAFENAPFLGSEEAQIYQKTYEYGATIPVDIDDIANSVIPEGKTANPGDMLIIKAAIDTGNTKYSYTSYVYDADLDETVAGSKWSAMDGNYSAANVFTNTAIKLSGDYGKDSAKHSITTIGNLKIGDEIAAGTSLQDVLKQILAKTLQPADPTNPAATIKLYNGSATAEAGAVEVGTTFTPRFAASLSAGSYTYGPATGVTASTYSVESIGRKTVKDATNDTKEDTATTASGTFDSFVVDEDTNYKVKVTITHGEGAVAYDNLGGLSNPQKKVAAGSKTDDSTSVTGFRGCFYGYYSEKKLTPSALTSAQVRALCTAPKTALNGFLTYDNTNKYYYITTNKMQQIFFAAPKGKYTSIAVANSTNGAPQTVTKITDVDVEGANGFAAADYDVWYVDNAGAESGETKFKVTIK